MGRNWSTPIDASNVTVPVHGPDSPVVDLLKACERIAHSDSTVLLTGETGTGKEVFARYIHQKSSRARNHLVPVNCGAIPENLLESELFGFMKGAFTGAHQSRKGRVALAEGGTLFLDEIGEMPLALQVKILRVLQERAYEPVGSMESVPANFRLIAATNRDLAAEVEAGRFRRDLYYRLLVCPVELPSLRERPGDVPLLFRHFWAKRGETRPVENELLDALCRYEWPGNIRELENVVERLSVVAEGPVLRLEDLPSRMRPRDTVPALSSRKPAPPVVTHEERATRPAERREALATEEFDPREAFGAASSEVPPEAEEEDGRLGDDERDALYSELRESTIEPTRPALPYPGLPAESFVAEPEPQPSNVSHLPQVEEIPGLTLPVDLPALLRQLEDAYLDAALTQSGGNRKAAADLLGLRRTTLIEKLKRRQLATGVPMPAPARARRRTGSGTP